MNPAPFVIERLLNAPVETVWMALTSREEMKHWYFDLSAFRPEPGFRFQFAGKGQKGESYLHLCEVKEVIPHKRLSYSWTYENYPGNSLLSFELFPEGDKTRLRLTHAGLESFPADNPDFARSSFEAGWTYLMGKALPEYLAR